MPLLVDLSSEAEHNPLKNRASVAKLDAQSTATELGRDQDNRRNLEMDGVLVPQPNAREKYGVLFVPYVLRHLSTYNISCAPAIDALKTFFESWFEEWSKAKHVGVAPLNSGRR